jgi:PhzF family phenazine biosynthesis protein
MGHTVSINLKFWQVDSFAEEAFKGNPAAVFVLREDIPDRLMQQIAIEMNQSETAFVLLRDSQNPLLRWFTPTFEIDLCGHATLASART